MPDTTVQTGTPFQDLPAARAARSEDPQSAAVDYSGTVAKDLAYVEHEPGVHKPDPILVADNVTRRLVA